MHWDIVIDFNPHTKTNGLYKAFMPEIENRVRRISLNEYTNSSRTDISAQFSEHITNWVFAAGLDDLQDTIPADELEWISLRYPQFINAVLMDYCQSSIKHLHFIFIEVEPFYYHRMILQLEISNYPDRISISYCSNNAEIINQIKNVKTIIHSLSFKLSIADIASGINSIIAPEEDQKTSILIPARHEGLYIHKDITATYNHYLSCGLQIVHENIVGGVVNSDAENITPFYYGNQITWKELSATIDVKRKDYADLQLRVKKSLDEEKRACRIDLYHKPGAGGTTLSRRLAYDFRQEYPVVILTAYIKNQTPSVFVNEFYPEIDRPVLIIAEQSIISDKELKDLLDEFKRSKKMAVVVYVQRTLEKKRMSDDTIMLYDTLADIDEKNAFLNAARNACANNVTLKYLQNLPVNNSEVIDYALAMSNNEYNRARLMDYLHEYTNHLPDDIYQFVVYVCLIDYYAHLNVSEDLFKSTFNKPLEEQFHQNQRLAEWMDKILNQFVDENGDEKWKPRYSAFVESLLELVLGKGVKGSDWKEKLPQYAAQLIDIVKKNDPYLTQESRKLLVDLFIGKDEADDSDRYSLLIRDIAPKGEESQKELFDKLSKSFPDEPHFWAHYGRFVADKAKDPDDCDEALGYINMAFEKGGTTDSTILHIAGMCLVRKLEWYKDNSIEIELIELQEIVETAKEFFDQSRSYNTKKTDTYALNSEIQLLCTALEYGKDVYGKTTTVRDFLLKPESSWFLSQYELMNELIDEANMLLQQLESYGPDKKIIKGRDILRNHEATVSRYLGNYATALDILERRIDDASRDDKPGRRRTFIRTLLLSKLHNSRDICIANKKDNLLEAWGKLSEGELAKVEDYIKANIMQDVSDMSSFRLWLDMVRYSRIDVTERQLLNQLETMYENTDNYLYKCRSAYYMYILRAIALIRKGYSFTNEDYDEYMKCVKRCEANSVFAKDPYEWLRSSNLQGLKCIVDNKRKNNFELEIVSGTIEYIDSPQQGKIELDCGLKAFFVPSIGGFTRGRDETKKVDFWVGFRHDGLIAFEVKPLGTPRKNVELNIDEGKVETTIHEGIREIDSFVDNTTTDIENSTEQQEVYKTDSELARPKIVGKIDLDMIKDSRKKK